jgi:hypothetical protein
MPWSPSQHTAPLTSRDSGFVVLRSTKRRSGQILCFHSQELLASVKRLGPIIPKVLFQDTPPRQRNNIIAQVQIFVKTQFSKTGDICRPWAKI